MSKLLWVLWLLLMALSFPNQNEIGEFWRGFIFGATCAAGPIIWAYKTHIDRKNDDIKSKADLISNYRIRLKEELPQSIYSRLSNKELKDKVFIFTKQLREFLRKAHKLEIATENTKIFSLRDPEIIEYREKFKPEGLCLWEELEHRLPDEHKTKGFYRELHNEDRLITALEVIATDLNRMATALPK
jgi:hypothetical protein